MQGLLILASCFAAAQDPQRALDFLQANHQKHFENQIRISQIPAPTFAERKRAEYIAGEFRRIGLQRVEIDEKNNVLGWRDGQIEKTLMVSAHLDTVFPIQTDVTVRKKDNRFYGPGLGDNSLGVATLLAVAEAMEHAGIRTRRTLLFVANCCEEGLGDLQGMKHLLRPGALRDRVEACIVIDGADPARIVNGALASKRYGITFRGPGGHSWHQFGRPSPIHALGEAISLFTKLSVPESPKSTYNVGLVGGGTSINSVAAEARMEVDMRSESDAELTRMERHLLDSVEKAVSVENKLRKLGGYKVEVESKLLAVRFGGITPVDSPLAQSAAWAAKRMGVTPFYAISSTDANVPINLGIPAVTLGSGGTGGNAHAPEEWYDPEGAWKGRQQLLLAVTRYADLQ